VELPDQSLLSFPKVEVDERGELWIAGVQRPSMEVEDPVGPVQVFHYDGSTWEDASPDLRSASAVELSVAGGQVWVAVADGRVAVRDDEMWTRHDLRQDAGDVKLTAVRPDNVYAIATARGEDDAQLVHYDGTGWSPVEELGDRPLRYVDGAGPHDVWATGYPRSLGRQVVVHFDGERWKEIDTSSLGDIAIPSALPDGRALLVSDLGGWLYDCASEP
jgi:hypothetical protein